MPASAIVGVVPARADLPLKSPQLALECPGTLEASGQLQPVGACASTAPSRRGSSISTILRAPPGLPEAEDMDLRQGAMTSPSAFAGLFVQVHY